MKTLLCVLALALSLAVVQAQSFFANLDGAQDGGGTRTGSGVFSLTLDANNVMTISGSFSGLSGTLRDAHIHGPAPIGQSVGVMYGLFSSITPGADNKSGTINATVSLVAGTRGFDIPTQIQQLNEGLWYFNIHSSTFTGGEIRGQIQPVPEPSTMVLAALAFGGFVAWRARQRRS